MLSESILAQSPKAAGPPPSPTPSRPYARPIDPDEAMVTALAQASSPDAFSCLYQLYYDQIEHYLYRLVGVREDAQEMAQTTFLKAYLAIGETDAGLRFGAWIYRTAHNVAMDELRHRKLWRMERLQSFEQVGWCHPALIAGHSVEHDALSEETERQVRRVLDTLPPLYRQVMILREYHDLDYDGIAARIGGSRARVKSLLYRARGEFRAGWTGDAGRRVAEQRCCVVCGTSFVPRERTQLSCSRPCQKQRKQDVNRQRTQARRGELGTARSAAATATADLQAVLP